ncbi:hypothetical protein M885DRAFT_547626 [Pelagophyceae sp. CCMP2097]|nr:hypothetical protein M885DRAFT_547626 [Pelagophyceae sp. CCMP2097]
MAHTRFWHVVGLACLAASAPQCEYEYVVGADVYRAAFPRDAADAELSHLARTVAEIFGLAGMTPLKVGGDETGVEVLPGSPVDLIRAALQTAREKCLDHLEVTLALSADLRVVLKTNAFMSGEDVVRTAWALLPLLPIEVLREEGCLLDDDGRQVLQQDTHILGGYGCSLIEKLEFSLLREHTEWLDQRRRPRTFQILSGTKPLPQMLSVSEAVSASTAHRVAQGLVRPRLVCVLKSGLTNQEMILNNCVHFAVAHNFDLVLPEPCVFLRHGGLGDSGNWNETADFGSIWDLQGFKIVLKRYGVSVVQKSSRDDDPVVFDIARFHNPAFWTLDASSPNPIRLQAPGPQSVFGIHGIIFAATQALVHSKRTLVLKAPFNAFTGDVLDVAKGLLVPTLSLRRRARRIIQGDLPWSYDCVHARIEEDWFHAWRSTHGGAASNFDDAAESKFDADNAADLAPLISGQGFIGAKQLAWYLKQVHDPARALYVASGATPEQLQVFTAAGLDARSRGRTDDAAGFFMAYDAAAVDREVCLGAWTFYGAAWSTLSLKIAAAARSRVGPRRRIIVYTDDIKRVAKAHNATLAARGTGPLEMPG